MKTPHPDPNTDQQVCQNYTALKKPLLSSSDDGGGEGEGGESADGGGVGGGSVDGSAGGKEGLGRLGGAITEVGGNAPT